MNWLRNLPLDRAGCAAAIVLLALAPSAGVAQSTPAPRPNIQFVIPGLPTPGADGQVHPAPPAPPAPRAPMALGRWWNGADMIKALDLTDDQRAKMDKVLTTTLELQATLQRKQIEARQRFEETLKAGDWGGAKQAASEWESLLAKLYGAQNTLKIDVMSLLNATQRTTFVTKHEYMLRRPWIGGPIANEFHMESGPISMATPTARAK